MKPTISVIGLGYVGLCTAVCFASRGFKVYGVDVDREKIHNLREGHSPIYEPHLEKHLNRTLRTRMFLPTDDVNSAVDKSDVTFVSVGTPSLDDGSIDLSSIKQSSSAIGEPQKQVYPTSGCSSQYSCPNHMRQSGENRDRGRQRKEMRSRMGSLHEP